MAAYLAELHDAGRARRAPRGEPDHPREVIEEALAHVVQNKVEAAYPRSDLLELAATGRAAFMGRPFTTRAPPRARRPSGASGLTVTYASLGGVLVDALRGLCVSSGGQVPKTAEAPSSDRAERFLRWLVDIAVSGTPELPRRIHVCRRRWSWLTNTCGYGSYRDNDERVDALIGGVVGGTIDAVTCRAAGSLARSLFRRTDLGAGLWTLWTAT